MRNEIVSKLSPEDQELQNKIAELAVLEEKLTEQELNLATLQSELNIFEVEYIRIVGARLAELDELEAKIAELEYRKQPHNVRLHEKAKEARKKAKDSAYATESINGLKKEKFTPSESLKKLFREVAKNIHPDLSLNENDRLKRQELMAAANCAYEEGDENKLRDILDEWVNSPESVNGEGTAAELVRVIRKISQVIKRLKNIEIEIGSLRKSDIYKLKNKAGDHEIKGRDLLNELAAQVGQDIAVAKKRLKKLSGDQAQW